MSSGILGPNRVEFTATTSDSLRLSCLLEKKQPLSDDVVVIAHGSMDNKRSPVIRGLAEGLPWNVVTFDFRGIGADALRVGMVCRWSFRYDWKMGESDGDSNLGNYFEEKEDLHAVCEHLCKQLRMKVIAIVSHSKGTLSTLLYATTYPSRSPLLILCNPPYSHDRPSSDPEFAAAVQQVMETGKPVVRGTYRNKGRVKEMVLTKEILLRRKAVDMGAVCGKVKDDVEVQVLTAANDEVLPVEDSRLFEKAFARRGIKMAVLPNCGHYYRTPREQAALAVQVRKYIFESVERRKAAEGAGAVGASAAKKKGGFKLKL
ncbi:hypothetical protein HDU93_003652 [Gonapodya sp. JEL0774]|nr:hypothetical protein HDU93_003652 [Gonapodya sp. JEL0774]